MFHSTGEYGIHVYIYEERMQGRGKERMGEKGQKARASSGLQAKRIRYT